MIKSIGGIAHDAVGSLATHRPSKTYDNLFEEKKAQLDTLQAGLARAALPKTPPITFAELGVSPPISKSAKVSYKRRHLYRFLYDTHPQAY